MVTGDHPTTAAAIAKNLEILKGDTEQEYQARGEIVDPSKIKSIVIHGQDMDAFTEKDWDRVLEHDEIVFARTQPV